MTPELTSRLADPLSDHRGVLSITARQIGELVPEITLDNVEVTGHLRDTGTFARLKERLLLPENYTVVGVFMQRFGQEWAILVESPDLPYTGDFAWEYIEYPRIEPVYCQTLNEETHEYEPHLVEIKVHAQRTVPIKGGLDWLLKATMEPTKAAKA